MHSNILIPKTINKIEIEGHCRGFQTELDFVEKNGVLIPIDTERVVPRTRWKSCNTLDNGLLYYLAYKIGTNTTDRALDSLFTASGSQAGVGAAQNAKDGIVLNIGGSTAHILLTTLNAGGAEGEAFIEFYGNIDGSIPTFVGSLVIGHNYDNSEPDFTTKFSSVSVSQAIAANRRYHHYWKFTFAEA